MDNMRIYSAGRSVPQEAQKQFNNGRFSGTDINPMWRIKKLTELFGPAGIGWYFEVLSERSEQLSPDTLMAVVDINLYIKVENEWSKPIFGTGGNTLVAKGKPSDEGYKMALTDALSVACKHLGIGADVYFDKDKTKYTAQKEETPMATPEQVKMLQSLFTPERYRKMLEYYGVENAGQFTKEQADSLIKAAWKESDERKNEAALAYEAKMEMIDARRDW